VDEVGGPTILATFTVIAALLPMAFVTGLMGPYMSPIPINASMGMFISLAIAFVITPWLALKLMKPAAHGREAFGHGEDAGEPGARPPLPPHDDTPCSIRAPAAPPGASCGSACWSPSWLGQPRLLVKLVVLKMLPFDNKSEFQVVLDMPVGTPLEETAKVLR
jgi:multidrug efflux pump subunit AcrB